MPATSIGLYARMTAVALVWGGSFTAGRMVAGSLPALVTATGRFLVAALLLVAIVIARHGRLPRLSRAELVQTALLGATGVALYNIFFLGALGHIPAGRTALIVALQPILSASLAAVLYRERISWLRAIGIAVALLGVLIVLSDGDLLAIDTSLGIGEALMFGGVMSWLAYTFIQPTAMGTLSALVSTTYATLWGLAFLALALLLSGTPIPWPAMGAREIGVIIYLGVLVTVVGFLWFAEGVNQLGPARAMIFTNLIPVSGVLSGALLLGEPILPSTLIGGLLVIGGVVLTNRR